MDEYKQKIVPLNGLVVEDPVQAKQKNKENQIGALLEVLGGSAFYLFLVSFGFITSIGLMIANVKLITVPPELVRSLVIVFCLVTFGTIFFMTAMRDYNRMIRDEDEAPAAAAQKENTVLYREHMRRISVGIISMASGLGFFIWCAVDLTLKIDLLTSIQTFLILQSSAIALAFHLYNHTDADTRKTKLKGGSSAAGAASLDATLLSLRKSIASTPIWWSYWILNQLASFGVLVASLYEIVAPGIIKAYLATALIFFDFVVIVGLIYGRDYKRKQRETEFKLAKTVGLSLRQLLRRVILCIISFFVALVLYALAIGLSGIDASAIVTCVFSAVYLVNSTCNSLLAYQNYADSVMSLE
jgi:hypothetical protein